MMFLMRQALLSISSASRSLCLFNTSVYCWNITLIGLLLLRQDVSHVLFLMFYFSITIVVRTIYLFIFLTCFPRFSSQLIRRMYACVLM